ncbi:family 78 glycoside hydrolase catalytic domain [Streptomyces sp. NPDC048288]|uniref:family 78 glycoside hydrolase catalytic domain n=1 Tax=Streptomyces sp. NPDC048288 TaxID=3365529 RepID=UPI003722A3BD
MAMAAAPAQPRFEHRTESGPVLGLGNPSPRLSWTLPSAAADFRQTAYEVEVRRETGVAAYRVESGEQVLVPWPATPLGSREAAAVRVRVAHGGDWSPWSEPAVAECGLLEPGDWSARFITPAAADGLGGQGDPAPVLTGRFTLPGRIRKARLYITAHGLYVPVLNGTRVGDEFLAPGWTAYQHRLRYQTHDVTGLVTEGENILEVPLGNGWFRGRIGFFEQRGFYGDRLALLAQLEVTTDDGSMHRFTTGADGSWTARESEILADDLYDGQITDLRRAGPAFPHRTGSVEVVDADLGGLVAPDGPPIRVTETVPAQKVWTSPMGRTLVDFGQNLVGWVRLRVRGAAGAEVTVRHAEVLENGEPATAPLRGAKAADTYYLADDVAEQTLEPTFTFHGFRYAEVQGVAGLDAADLDAVVLGSDLPRSGWFSSSDPLLDRLHENVVWGMRGNFLDVPTDCPQRDERLGWTGDIQVFAPTATYLHDAAGFLTSWLADLAAEQYPDGSVPFVIPDVLCTPTCATAAWADAAVLVPWALYERTGDRGILRRQLRSMCAWVDKVTELAGPDRVWGGGFQFGDWLDPTAPEANPYEARTDPDLVATAYFARSAQILAEAAALLDEPGVAEKYRALAQEVRAAFARTFVTGAGIVHSDTQTAYALAIAWDLLPEEHQRRLAGRRLADLVRTGGFRIGTGFVGTPIVCDALTATGHTEVAYRLLLQTGCPSWLYPLTMGATTIWERWDSMLPDGRVNGSGMTSFNHYALGAVADWLHRTVAGLAPAAPGYRTITVRPLPTAALTHAATRHVTPYGPAAVSWTRRDGRYRLDVEVPVGASAEIHLPGGDEPIVVGHGAYHWESADPVVSAGRPEPVTVRDLLDDAQRWPAIVEAAAATGVAPRGEAEVAGMVKPYLDAPAAFIAKALVPPESFRPGGALEERIADILGG